MKKLFRFHRGGLVESLATTLEVRGVDEIRKIVNDHTLCSGHFKNIRIEREPHADRRLSKEWGGISYYVLADFDGYSGQCVGMCNFYEEE